MLLAAGRGGTLVLRAGLVSQEQPTFRSRVQIIDVDVVVTDKNGSPVRDLIRLVAEQPGGPLGSVIAPIEASTFEDDLELSGVALAPRRANEVLLVGDRGLRSALSNDPTARRSFRASDGLTVYAEVYSPLDEDLPPARIGLIRVATLAAGIISPTGEIVARGQSQRVSAEGAGKTLREGFRTDVDLSRLTPGQYVLALEGRHESNRGKTVRRQIPLTVE
ncbi:MAG TPA: hypothetical protein VFV95_21190 [Vicinamibacterales bacterium]|nr:hypothetical protein [Vicinamibacterales bacterium]